MGVRDVFRRQTAPGSHAERTSGQGGAVLVASGVKIEKTMNPEVLRSMASNRQEWQSLAWGYRDLIGELRFALQFRARALSRMSIYAAQIDPENPHAEEPIPLSLRNHEDAEKRARVTVSAELAAAAEEELARLPLSAGYSFLGVWSENFDTAGECWLHARTDPATGDEVWSIRSVSEVGIGITSVTVEDESLAGYARQVDLDTEELYRLWVPHPQRARFADSPLRAMIDVLEDIVLIGRELRAVARSRIASNGLMLIPRGLTKSHNTLDETTATDPAEAASTFVANFTAGLTAPISNEGHPGAIAPMVLIGELADLEAVRHVKLDREDSPTLLDKQGKALSRMANGLDVPPEIVTGMAEVNHWTAWQIDSATARHHLEPGARIMVDSLTQAFLRRALIKRGFPPEEVKLIRAWYDLGGLTENPNRRQDALDAFDRLGIGPEALRDALGFAPEDAPSLEEMLLMIALKQGVEPATATALLRLHVREEGGDAPELESLPSGTPQALPAGEPRPTPAGAPAAPAPTGGVPVAQRPPNVVASASRPRMCSCGADLTLLGTCSLGMEKHDALIRLSSASSATFAAEEGWRYRVMLEESARLVEVDRALRSQILAAADQAMVRALEKAGSRLRAKATARPELSARLRGVEALAVGKAVGRTQALALNADDGHLLAGAFAALGERFVSWTLAAIETVATRVLRMLGFKIDSPEGRKVTQRLRSDMGARVDQGWERLHEQLLQRASRLVFSLPTEDEQEDGEPVEGTVPPYIVRGALAVVGGLPETSGGLDEYGRSVTGEPVGGLGNGEAVRHELEEHGGYEVGYTWVYGITTQDRRFDPHWDLEAERFAGWTDPKLATAGKYGDRYVWVGENFQPGDHVGCMCDYVPAWALPAYAEQVADRLAVPTQDMANILALAAGDDAAGRTGTTAQEERARWQHIQQLQSRFLEGS